MAVNFGHTGYTSNVDKITDTFNNFFSTAFQDQHKNKFFNLREVKTVVGWYQQANEFKDKIENEMLSSDPVLMVANNIIERQLEKMEPYYQQCLIEKIESKTQFRDGKVENNFKVGLIPIKSHVDFTKEVNSKDICTIRFRFNLNTKTYISRLRIRRSEGKMLCDIEKVGMELELSLIEITVIYVGTEQTNVSFKKTIKLAHKKFEIQNLVLKVC
jgi:hypothetical protein